MLQVFATSSHNGHVYIYDLLSSDSTINPYITLKTPTLLSKNDDTHGAFNNSASFTNSNSNVKLEEKIPVYCIAFHKKIPNVLAAGDGDGIVHIWQLPSKLTQPSRKEHEYKCFKKL